MMRIDGRSAIVTGGASGLGLATVRRLAAADAAVVIVDLPGSRGAEVAAELGDRVRFAPADVRSEDEVQAALDVAESLVPLAVAVNCAGVADAARVVGRGGPFPLETFRRVVDINLVGTFNVVRSAAARMAAHDDSEAEERGVIIDTASVAAFDGQIGQAAYAASKGGVAAMTLPIARDLASARIRIVTIAPGLFRTPMFDGLDPKAIASLESQTPHPARLGEPEEYADLVAHIVANPMLNGEVIRLDGAIRLPPR